MKEGKPRGQTRPSLSRYSARLVAKKKLKVSHKHPGAVSLWDYSPSGGRSGLVVGVTGPKGGMSKNPTDQIARRIRAALVRPPVPDVLVYDGAGNLLRRLDGLTKKEKPL